MLFLYDVIQWTQSAVIGINAGDGKASFTLPQSGDDTELAKLETASNTRLPGEFILSSGNGRAIITLYLNPSSHHHFHHH